MLRVGACLIGSVGRAAGTMAGEMTAEEARRFVIGKTFSYNCFEEARAGRAACMPTGPVVGSIQFQGAGKVALRGAAAPTRCRSKASRCAASLRGLPIEPCFNLKKIDEQSFRGSISRLGFAYCEFTRRTVRASASTEDSDKPLGLRPSFAASNNNNN